ncbi:TonB-dependent receptor plug domain-containing protein [Flavobacterium sp. RHBU_24]|uniref:TonB-dependent receptor plug domain-containing protein n=1 Tax=Flavobacterium sp. RHBU_24 TaxID=3391185 RepID=UPI0039848C43
MKTLLKIAFLFITASLFAQQGKALKTYYTQQQPEKIYAHLNNVLYLPEETVYYKLYGTMAGNNPYTKSDYVYVDIYDPSGKKADAQTYMLTQGGAAGSFTLSAEAPSGMYVIKAYTRYQQQLGDTPFEKQFFVQKVIAPRVLMTLDFKKKGYGAGESAEADFVLKNNQNLPIRNQNVEFEIFIAGKTQNTLTAVTDTEGKATLAFSLPDDLQSNDGIINVKVLYDNIKESITKSIPINLNFADLQFLPEGGNYIAGQPSNLFFIAKNEFGKPLDVSGYIQDEAGNRVQEFTSFYDGMGKVAFTPQANKKYSAVITSPFRSEKRYEFPIALSSGYQLNVGAAMQSLAVAVYSPEKASGELLLRSQDKVVKSIPFNAKEGSSMLSIETKGVPMGTYAVSLLINGQIVAERLVFINYQDGLSIELTTDKEVYGPREQVKVTVVTKDEEGKPVPSSLSVAVVDEKLLTYMDDKQHNLLTWMFFGFELKGNVHEPRFYFDEKEPLEKRLTALDLLLNTHGWRRFSQSEINAYDGAPTTIIAERSNDIEGFVLDNKNEPASLKVYLISDTGKVYETHSDKSGFFKFTRTHFEKNAMLATEGKRGKEYTIKNSVSDIQSVLKLKEEFKVAADAGNKVFETPGRTLAKPADAVALADQKGEAVNMKEASNNLEEVVVVGYGAMNKRAVTGAVTVVSAHDFSVTKSLAGMLAGVNVTMGTGAPGSGETVRIRGVGTVNGNLEPLVVVDGAPYSRNENGSVLGGLNPQMIESLTVLKDAAATAIYGSRGGNGVIIITTKRGAGGNGILLGKKRHYTFEEINKDTSRKLNIPAGFYAPVYTTTETEQKTDFRNCIYWNATVQTDTNGSAAFDYYNSDETATFTIWAEGTSYKGDLGLKKHSYAVKEPVETDLKLPLFTTQEDEIKIPLRVKNNSDKSLDVDALLSKSGYFETVGDNIQLSLTANESRVVYFTIKAVTAGQKIPVRVTLSASGHTVAIDKTIDIYSKGFPKTVNFSGVKTGAENFVIQNPVPGSIESGIKFITNPYNSFSDGIESMLREPHGCFEQASSSNYPNVMALQLLTSRGINDDVKKKALSLLKKGYEMLKGYESKSGGFEWFGGDPGHEALTAYGLLQFHEMQEFMDIDKDMINRSIKWLNKRKDGRGGYTQHSGLDAIGHGKYEVVNAYIVFVLSEMGQKENISEEYRTALAEALKSKDAYRSSLVAIAAYNLGDMASYRKLLDNIKGEVAKLTHDKVEADATIVNSYDLSKSIEWASLYAMAIMKGGNITPELPDVLNFIQSSKKLSGFGSTQATALAMKAITNFSRMTKAGSSQAKITATINNVAVNISSVDDGGNISVNTTGNINGGTNSVNVNIENGKQVPYLFYVSYSSYQPENSPECQLSLKTGLTRSKIKVSETTRLEAQVTNNTNAPVANPLVRIGIPGGTSPEIWQLKELVDKNVIAYYEIFGSELVLYLRSLNAREIRNINIDLKAQVPGMYKGIASSAYLYYNNEHKNWISGLEVEIIE